MIPTSFPTLEPSIQPTFPPTLSPTITANPSAIGGIPTTRQPVVDIRPDSTSTSKDYWGPGWWGDDDDWSRPQWKPEWTSSPKHTKSGKHAKSWGKSGKSGRKRSWSSSSDSGDVYDWSVSKSSSASADGWGMSISSHDWSSWNTTAWPDHWKSPGKSGKSGFDWGKRGKSGSAIYDWSSSGKSGKSGSDFKPKANKGDSEDSPGKELIYDDDAFPSWHNSDGGWSSSSSGKSGKSGGKLGNEWVESGWNARSSASMDENYDDTISASDDVPIPPPPPVPLVNTPSEPVDNDTSQPTYTPSISPVKGASCTVCPNGITVGEETQPLLDSGDTSTCKELVDQVNLIGTDFCDGDSIYDMLCCPNPNSRYWTYTNNGNEMTCVYSLTEPEDVLSTDWIHDTKEECCVYVYGLGGDQSTVSGCSEFAPSAQGPPLSTNPNRTNPNNANVNKVDRSRSTTSKSAKPSYHDIDSILQDDPITSEASRSTSKSSKKKKSSPVPMPSSDHPHYKQSKSTKSSRNRDYDTLSPTSSSDQHHEGTKSDVKYSEGLADGMAYSGYKQKSQGNSRNSEKPQSSSAVSYFSIGCGCVILLSSAMALLEFDI